MKKLSLLLVMMCAAILFSCDKDEPSAAVVVDLTIDLNLENANGQDLLNPATPNAIHDNDIKVFYDVDGAQLTYTELNQTHGELLDYPGGFFIIQPEVGATKYTLRVFGNSTIGEAVKTTLKIDGREEIEFTTRVQHANGNILIEEIWLKENLIWSRNSENPKYFTIVLN